MVQDLEILQEELCLLIFIFLRFFCWMHWCTFLVAIYLGKWFIIRYSVRPDQVLK